MTVFALNEAPCLCMASVKTKKGGRFLYRLFCIYNEYDFLLAESTVCTSGHAVSESVVYQLV